MGDKALPYSARKLFTGFASAALTDWTLTVSNVITNAPDADAAKIHQLISVLYA